MDFETREKFNELNEKLDAILKAVERLAGEGELGDDPLTQAVEPPGKGEAAPT